MPTNPSDLVGMCREFVAEQDKLKLALRLAQRENSGLKAENDKLTQENSTLRMEVEYAKLEKSELVTANADMIKANADMLGKQKLIDELKECVGSVMDKWRALTQQ
jgi:cell division protein FtsB